MLNNKSVILTGGTGSFGKKFTEMVLKKYPKIKKLVIFSRGELKQFEMSQVYPSNLYPQIRFLIGDVRDGARVKRAFEDIDIVIHAAALKQVPTAEYNPDECIKTNIGGAQNVIDAAMATHVNVVIALSTDKAAAPINLYGATKLVSDKLFIAANNIRGWRDLKFAVVRYGNVMGSRGSVIPYFIEKAKNGGVIPITHKEMTRFNISLEEGVEMVLWTVKNSLGGELFVPKIPSFTIGTLVKAIAPGAKFEYVGIRPGEKLHEDMITESDSYSTIDIGKYYVILPSGSDPKAIMPSRLSKAIYMKHYNAKAVKPGFRYNSGENEQWVNVEEMRELIRKHVDKNFSPISV